MHHPTLLALVSCALALTNASVLASNTPQFCGGDVPTTDLSTPSPAVSESSTTAPTTSDISVSTPDVTDVPTTAPEVTDSPSTAAGATEAPASDASVTEAPTTVPTATIPPTSNLVDTGSVTSDVSDAVPSTSSLPVFYFHGIVGEGTAGDNIGRNLTAEGRVFVELTFCQNDCSIESLLTQVPLAIAQVRDTVANNSQFDDGYVFIGHSQGGAIARAVIEEMDDHNVRSFLSLAGIQNGLFTGPADAEAAAQAGAAWPNTLVPATVFNFSKYSHDDYFGQLQYDYAVFTEQNADVQYQYSQLNLARSPVHAEWAASNPFLPVINNINPCETTDTQCLADQARRKANFLRLEAAHFFSSPGDGSVTPWKSSLLGQCSELDTLDQIITDFESLTVLDMTETLEYTSDTYGLRTLDERGGLFLHEAPDVSHSCWVRDESTCVFQPVYDEYIYPALQ
ncbi:hypothetical protein BBJ28_00002008 [Nothophytophthora sp. Chile5]|nr:hypothetical protein BBJ28_00002008 [Nothophytophthora sp. Chile5]